MNDTKAEVEELQALVARAYTLLRQVEAFLSDFVEESNESTDN